MWVTFFAELTFLSNTNETNNTNGIHSADSCSNQDIGLRI